MNWGFVASIVAVLFIGGLVVGYLNPRRLLFVFIASSALAILLGAAICVVCGADPSALNLRYVRTAIPYLVLPFLGFFLVPAWLGSAFGRMARRWRMRGNNPVSKS